MVEAYGQRDMMRGGWHHDQRSVAKFYSIDENNEVFFAIQIIITYERDSS